MSVEKNWQGRDFWTDEKVAQLKQLWADGYSASEIAEKIRAASRSAVIGRIHRMGLKRSPEVQKQVTRNVMNRRFGTGPRVREIRAARPVDASAPPPWTPARVATLTAMWSDGKTGTEIALALGVTIHNVYTRIRTLGLVRRSQVATQATKEVSNRATARALRPSDMPQRRPSLQISSFDTTRISAVNSPRSESSPKTLADIGKRECRWPIGEDPGEGFCHRLLFCATPLAETDEGSYCAHHHRRAYHKTRTPEQRAIDEAKSDAMRSAHGHRGDHNTFFHGRKARAA